MICTLAIDTQKNPITTVSRFLHLSVSAVRLFSAVAGEAWFLRHSGSPRIDCPSASAGCTRLPVQHPCSGQECPSPEARG